MVTKKAPKNAKIFECKNCDFICSKSSDYNRHQLTLKHKNGVIGDAWRKINEIYKCEKCLKQYKSRNGLWVHTKKCVFKQPIVIH